MDPIGDLEIIHNELRLKASRPGERQRVNSCSRRPDNPRPPGPSQDLERCRKTYETFESMVKRGLKKEQKDEMDICAKVIEWLESGKDIRFGDWNQKEVGRLC